LLSRRCVERGKKAAELGMPPERRAVIERLRYDRALIGIAIQLRLHDVDIAVLVDAEGVDGAGFGLKLSGSDKKPFVLLQFVQGNTSGWS
jgi:hypothetical protein